MSTPDLGDVPARLVTGLAAHQEASLAALAAARGVKGPDGFEVSSYGESLRYPARLVDFAGAFTDWPGFLADLATGQPGAVELAVALLARLHAAALLELAPAIAAREPWPLLWRRLAHGLSLLDDQRAFAWLVEHRDAPHVVPELGRSPYAAGAGVVLALVRGNPALEGSAPYENRDQFELRNLLAYLARHRVEEAWELLAAVYRRHPDGNVVNDAGWALRRWGDGRSLALVETLLSSPDRTRERHALQLLLARDAAAVIDRLGGSAALLEPGASALVGTLLHLVTSEETDARRERRPSRGWLAADPRFLDLALRWVKEKEVKGSAQHALELAPREAVEAARARALVSRKPPARKAAKKSALLLDVAALLARFDAGEQVAVLAELTKLGERVREPRLAATAELLARRAMERARHGLELIVERLDERGYRFVRRHEALGPPATLADVDALEQAVGPLPIVLRAAYLVLGGVDLRGSHPDFPRPASLELSGVRDDGSGVWETDPLVLIPARAILDEARDHAGADAAFSLPLAPDATGKAGFSGGTVTLELPACGFDAAIDGVGAGAAVRGLVPLLRASLASGGFPGLSKAPGAPRGFARRWLAGLVVGLEPF